MLMTRAVGKKMDGITSSDEACRVNQWPWHPMRPLQRTRQTHKGAVNEEHNVISASDSSAARSEKEENCFTESMSDEMHHIHSKIPQMEAEWRGVSQQEDRCVTEQINQPLGIEWDMRRRQERHTSSLKTSPEDELSEDSPTRHEYGSYIFLELIFVAMLTCCHAHS